MNQIIHYLYEIINCTMMKRSFLLFLLLTLVALPVSAQDKVRVDLVHADHQEYAHRPGITGQEFIAPFL